MAATRTTSIEEELAARIMELEQQQEERISEALAEERARIARELHDVVSHGVNAIVLLSGSGRLTATRDPALATGTFERIEATGRETLGEMRKLLKLVHQDAEPLGGQPPGLAGLDHLVATARASGLEVLVSRAGSLSERLPRGVDLAAYRIVQEALTNVFKHAGPGTPVEIRVTRERGWLELEVLDQGGGNGHRAPAPAGAGHGLIGMRERVALHGGRLEAGPRREGGFRVLAVLHTRSAEVS